MRARFSIIEANGKTRPTKIQNKTTFQKIQAIMDALYFSCSYFWSLKTKKKTPEIIAQKNSIISLVGLFRSNNLHNNRYTLISHAVISGASKPEKKSPEINAQFF